MAQAIGQTAHLSVTGRCHYELGAVRSLVRIWLPGLELLLQCLDVVIPLVVLAAEIFLREPVIADIAEHRLVLPRHRRRRYARLPHNLGMRLNLLVLQEDQPHCNLLEATT